MRVKIFVLAIAVALALSGCAGNDKPVHRDDTTLAPRLAKAKAALDDAETLTVTLATKSLPSGITGLLSASGRGNHSPAFSGEVKVVVAGSSVSAKVVSVDGKVYAKTGFSPVFLTINPASLQAPDPASLMARNGGISDLLTAATKLADAGKTRDGSTVLSAISGTLAGSVVQSLVPSADPTKNFQVSYRLTDDGQLHDATMKGPFYPNAGDTSYTVTVATSDTPITIRKP